MDNKDIVLNEIFTNTFNEAKFNKFIINLLNLDQKDRLNGVVIKENSSVYENHIEYVKDLGKYTDEGRKIIVASIVKLKDSPDKARTLQRNFIARHLKDIGADAAVVALYSDNSDIWRISFVKLDTTFNINELTGNLEIKEDITPAKRYSYLIEPKLKNHTVQEQLRNLLFNDIKKPSVEEIENVFSVEVVTDEFFKMYRDKYLDLKEFLETNNEFIQESKRLMVEVNEFSEEFAKKLMGQVAFLYFLQKKGWLGVKIVPKNIDKSELRELYRKQNEETREIITKSYKSKDQYMVIDSTEVKKLSDDEADMLASVFKNSKYDEEWGRGTKTFIRDIFEVCKRNNKNFFNDYLEPLFYNALNKRRGSNEYYQRFNCKIPFLNGGLFEPIYKYEWENISIEIPNEFFSNENNDNKKGLLDFFDMYNFTMNEDEPLEKEVAVDPEMLGKIFENLLDVKERKSKGAFYTPREIVHYMCQECLINYLHNETKIDTTSLELLIKYGEVIKDVDLSIEDKKYYKMPKFIIDNLEIIDKALENVTVADPSVGSGAFPLGMLNEIVKARSILVEYMTKDLDEWKKEDFIRDNKKSLYDLKKNAMKKSIFAVDIEPSAVDITKLRLWLSLVVDADVRTINTLPNLDYNIMVGNSLIEEFNGIKLFDEDLLKERTKRKKKTVSNQISMNIEGTSANIGIEQEYQLLEDIQKLQGELFDEKDNSKKVLIKKEIESKEWDLIEYKLTREKKLLFKETEELKKHRKSNRKPYFLWELEFSKVFKVNGGFDIVIGNPPYIGEKGNKEIFHEVKVTKFGEKFYQRRMDFFYFFIAKGVEILKSKGQLGFITTNYWITATGGQKNLRPYLKSNTNIKKYIDFREYKIFESALGQHNCIFILEKNIEDKDSKTHVIEVYDHKQASKYNLTNILNNISDMNGIKSYLSQSQCNLYEDKTFNIRFNDDRTNSTLQKIMINSDKKLDDICIISGGVSSSADKVTKGNIKHCSDEEIESNNIVLGNGVLVLNKEELETLNLGEKELGYIKPLYKSSEIKPYWSNNIPEKFLIYATHNNAVEIEKCNNIYKHLKRYETILKNRSQDIELANAMKKGHWFVLTNGRNKINFNDEKIVCPYRAKSNVFGYNNIPWYAGRDVYFLVDFKENINYIMGVLNSTLIKFWLKNKGKMKGDIFEIYPEPLRNIPVVINNKSIKMEIESKVQDIIKITQNNNVHNISDTLIGEVVSKLVLDIDNLVYKLYGLDEEDINYIKTQV